MWRVHVRGSQSSVKEYGRCGQKLIDTLKQSMAVTESVFHETHACAIAFFKEIVTEFHENWTNVLVSESR
jgi:hypothetical protein